MQCVHSSSHWLPAASAENFPAAHTEHDVEAPPEEREPPLQGEHARAEAYWPGVQMMQPLDVMTPAHVEQMAAPSGAF